MEDDASQDVWQNIKKYAEKGNKRREDAMEVEIQDSSTIEAHLTSTIDELQARLEQRQAELNGVCND
jgi:hypothetical protein